MFVLPLVSPSSRAVMGLSVIVSSCKVSSEVTNSTSCGRAMLPVRLNNTNNNIIIRLTGISEMFFYGLLT